MAASPHRWAPGALVVLAAGLLLAGCSCDGAAPAADRGLPDAGPPEDLPPRPDQFGPPPPDVRYVHDRWVRPDRARDTGVPVDSCGGSRALSPQVVKPYAALPCGKACKQLTFGYFVEKHYEVVGDRLVYIADRGGTQDVYHLDLKTGKERLLQKHAGLGNGCHKASTDGQKLAYTCVRTWSPTRSFYRSLSLYDPKTGVEQDLTCILRERHKKFCSPGWLTMGSTGVAINMSLGSCQTTEVMFYRFSDGALLNLSNMPGASFNPHMEGHRVVFSTYAVGWPAMQVVAYDTKKLTKKRLLAGKGDQDLARIHGADVVWTDHRNGSGNRFNPTNTDIYHHDLATGKTTQVTTDPGTQEYPDVWERWVVWMDWRHGPTGLSRGKGATVDIYARDMKTKKEHRLTSMKGNEAYPRVDGERVFFRKVDKKGWASVFVIDLKKRLP